MSARTIRQRIEQGNLALAQENFEEARGIFREILEDHPDFADVHNKLGLCRAMLGDERGALESFDTALDLAPEYAEAHVNRGIILSELGRLEEAETAFERSMSLDTREGHEFPSRVGNEIAWTHAELGDLYAVVGMNDEAAVQYRKSLEVRPRFLDVRVKLGEALLKIDADREAREQLELVLQQNPEFWSARLRLGQALERLGEREAAIAAWEEVLRQRPGEMRARGFIARAKAAGTG